MPVSRLVIALAASFLLACGSDGGPDKFVGVRPDTAGHRGVDLTVAVDQDRHPISPLIYGSSQDDGTTKWTVRRYGGNRLTGYNWENNFSNAGSDWFHSNDNFLIADAGLPGSDASIPARAVTHFHDQSIAMGAQSIVTLQMAGYVSRDGKGTVLESETAPSPRWVRVEPKKNAPFTTTPDTSDGVVYMDELVNLLVQRYGAASAPNGVKWYSLDNEVAIWPYTHPRIHPSPLGVQELLDRSVALAAAVKDVDPAAGITGPVSYGIGELVDLQGAPDWSAVRGGAVWFADLYLDRMKAASDAQGRRLLDAFDFHYYPEARGDHRVTDGDANTPADITARLQAPRMLWDASYREPNSWVSQWLGAYLPVIPRVKQSIAEHFPGTKLAITEYDFGGRATISGGIAQADVLGIFGREGVDIATAWGMGPSQAYGSAAFRLFRDYDGQGHAFGSTSVRALTSDTARVSVYASTDDASASVLHLVILNKDQGETLTVRVHLSGGAAYTSGRAWAFDATHAGVTSLPALTGVSASGFAIAVPALSATHVVLRTTP